MAAPSVEELNELFAPGGKPLEQDVVAELQSIARLHQLSAQDLFFKWESYCIKMELEGNQLSLDTVRALKQDIQSALERSNRAQSARHLKGGDKRTVATPRAAKGGDADVFGM